MAYRTRLLEAELKTRGYSPAGNRTGDYTWRRYASWHRQFDGGLLRIEIYPSHKLCIVYPDRMERTVISEDFADAVFNIAAAELTAQFPD